MPTATAPTTAAAAAAAALPPSILRRHAPPPPAVSARPPARPAWRPMSCQVALTTEVPSSSSLASEAEEDGMSKVGARVRVTVSLKVYHVTKAPDLDLSGLEGTIKQFVGLWKGKSISANLPFKVEFLLPVEGEAKPVKFFVHLKEDEFEYLPVSSD